MNTIKILLVKTFLLDVSLITPRTILTHEYNNLFKRKFIKEFKREFRFNPISQKAKQVYVEDSFIRFRPKAKKNAKKFVITAIALAVSGVLIPPISFVTMPLTLASLTVSALIALSPDIESFCYAPKATTNFIIRKLNKTIKSLQGGELETHYDYTESCKPHSFIHNASGINLKNCLTESEGAKIIQMRRKGVNQRIQGNLITKQKRILKFQFSK